jgi:hypothetical protein
MADFESNLKIKVGAEDKTGGVFKSVGDKMKGLEQGTGSLTSSLAKLGLAGVALYAGFKVFEFFKESIQASTDAAATLAIAANNIRNAGLAVDEVMPKYEKFGKAAVQLGFDDEQAVLSLSRFAQSTKDVGKQQDLTRLAMDMARASGTSLESATGTLMSVLGGNVRVLKEYGINLKASAGSAEALDALQVRLTGSAATFAKTNAGQMQVMTQTWANFKEQVGDTFGPALNVALTNFNNFLNISNENSNEWAKSLSAKIAIAVNPDTWMLTGKTVGTGIQNLSTKFNNFIIGGLNKLGLGLTPVEDTTKQSIKEITDLANKIRDTTDAALNLNKGFKPLTDPNPNFAGLGKGADEASKAADKLAQSFQDFSKSVVSSFDEQSKAIDSLRANLADLDAGLSDSINKSNQKYTLDVENLARKAKDKMDTIDKQIADEKRTMGQGWRDKVADLEKQKATEKAILDRAGGVVSDLQSELQKNEFDILQDAHNREIDDIRNQNEAKKKLMQEEIDARQAYLDKIQTMVVSPDFYKTITSEGTSFLGAIGASPGAQSLIFNFNGGVAGDDGIKKIISDTIAQLNRQATLHGVAGK